MDGSSLGRIGWPPVCGDSSGGAGATGESNRMRMIGVIGVTLLALILRLYRLGALGFAGNEDYLALSVRSVLDNLIPLFPSGVVYPRALPLTYISSLFAALFGYSELILRLPAVLFSVGSVILLYLLGRRLFGPGTALLAALLLAVSDWDLTTARTARMYSMLAFFVLLSVLLFYRASVDRDRWARILLFPSILMACLLNQLAFALVPLFACLALYHHGRGVRPWLAAACMLVTVLGLAGNDWFEQRHYGEWNELARERAGGFAPTENEAAVDKSLRRLEERALPVLTGLRNTFPNLFMALGTVAILLVLLCAVLFIRRPGSRAWLAALAATVTALFLQQVMLALCILVAYLFAGRRLEGKRYLARGAILLAAIAGGAGLWLLYALASPASFAAGETTLGALLLALKSLFYYPRNFGLMFLERYPWLTLIVAAGLVVTAARALRNLELSETGLVGLLLVAPGLLLGSHLLAFSRFYERYVHFLLPFFLLLAARFLVATAGSLRSILERRRAGRSIQAATLGLAVLLLAWLTGIGGATRSWAVVRAGYGLNEPLSDRWSEMRPFHPDHRGPALFVKERIRPGDTLIAMDILACSVYLPAVDYQLALSAKGDAEGWFGVRTLASAGALEEVLDAPRRGSLWVVLAEPEVTRHSGNPEMAAILDLLEDRAGEPAFLGRDGRSDVFHLPDRGSLSVQESP